MIVVVVVIVGCLAEASGFDVANVAVILTGGFLVKAVIEEIFYRRWLQTRLETTFGIPAAIGSASILWAVWHAGIQGIGSLDVNLAAAIANHLPWAYSLAC